MGEPLGRLEELDDRDAGRRQRDVPRAKGAAGALGRRAQDAVGAWAGVQVCQEHRQSITEAWQMSFFSSVIYSTLLSLGCPTAGTQAAGGTRAGGRRGAHGLGRCRREACGRRGRDRMQHGRARRHAGHGGVHEIQFVERVDAVQLVRRRPQCVVAVAVAGGPWPVGPRWRHGRHNVHRIGRHGC